MTGKLRKRRKAQPAKPAARPRPAKGFGAKGFGAKSFRTKSVAKAERKRRPAAAAKPADVVETLVAAYERELKLPIAPAWRAGVKSNLRVILLQAALVDQFPLPDEIEPAPVFRA
jgi:hypothetical protein